MRAHDWASCPQAAQRLFFSVAHAYCKANNLDLTPEADTGNGPVDFKVSAGFTGRVLVEIKLSANGKLVKAYSRQLETYKTAEETQQGYYVVLDVGQMGEKAENLIATKNAAAARGGRHIANHLYRREPETISQQVVSPVLLDAQLMACNQTEAIIDMLVQPLSTRRGN